MMLTQNDIFPILKAVFPARNNYHPCSYAEEFADLMHFKVDTTEKLTELLNRQYSAVMGEDANVEIDDYAYDWSCDEMGKAVIDERIEQGYWYSFTALLRLALLKEFGDDYEKYASERDGF